METVHLLEGLEYEFTIVDFMGDGICCWAGNGWYSLYEEGDVEIVNATGDVSEEILCKQL